MATDPRLLLAGRGLDVGSTFDSILRNVSNLDTIQRERELAPLRQQALEQSIAAGDLSAQRQQGINLDERDKRRLNSTVQFGNKILPILQGGDVSRARNLALSRLGDLATRIEAGEDVDTTETEQFLTALDTNPEQALQMAQQAVDLGRQLNQGQLSSPERIRQNLLRDLSSDDQQVRESAEIALQIKAPVRTTGEERILTDQGLSEKAIAFAGAESAAKEEGKLVKQLKFKPQITRAVRLAEAEASERGEVLTDLKRMNAALPGLQDAIGQLRELAPIATSTLVGRAFDSVVRETGFGATKGGTARAKYASIIINQVLPLLKPTFGAAFTVQEGDKLEATMGDINLSPEEKLAQLDAFIAQKTRDIETKERQLGDTTPQDLTNLSVEELNALLIQAEQG